MTNKEATKHIKAAAKLAIDAGYSSDIVDACALAVRALEQEPKTGHWSHDGSHWENRWVCSECGYKLFDEQTRFCSNCGAKMRRLGE